MSPLVLELVASPLEAVAAELAVVAFFADDRPLTGGAGRADWRLCGGLSRLLRAGQLRGEPGEAALIPSQGGVAAPLVLALGLGARTDFGGDGLARFCAEALDRARRLRRTRIALGWPDRLRPGPAEQMDALLAAVAAEAARPDPGLESIRLAPASAETPTLAEVLRTHAETIPSGVTLIVPPPQASEPRRVGPRRGPEPPPVARMRIK
jgi:hypothetical protein